MIPILTQALDETFNEAKQLQKAKATAQVFWVRYSKGDISFAVIAATILVKKYLVEKIVLIKKKNK